MQGQEELAAVIEASCENLDEFSRKLNWLKEKWSNATDSVYTRSINPIIGNTNAINSSIIEDDLNYFQVHYKENYGSCLELAMEAACLCGSRRIAEFLLIELNLDYLSEGYEHILSYVSASMNSSWAGNIANAMARAGKKIPQSVYGLAHRDSVLDTIVGIFESAKLNTAYRYK